MSMPWPSEKDPVVQVQYELVAGFNGKGEPVCKSGVEKNPARLQMITELLERQNPVPASIPSITMGNVLLLLQSGGQLSLRPVFHISSGLYSDLCKVNEYDLPMPDLLADLLNKWREELSDE